MMNGFIRTRSFMKIYAIHWKSIVNGSIGTGTKLFEKEVAERLATELNESYPDINHEAVISVHSVPGPTAVEPATVSPG